MRRAKWIFALWSLWFATAVFSLDREPPAYAPDTARYEAERPEYAVYETAIRADGCRWVYIVPRPRLFVLPGDVPAPLLLAPGAAGMRGTVCADGSWSEWRREDLTADDLAAPRYGATLSSMKLFNGDFDGDGRRDLLLQAGDRVRHSLLLSLDVRGTPRVLRNLRRSLSAIDYPLLNVADSTHNGRTEIVAAPGHSAMSWAGTTDDGAALISAPAANAATALAATFNVSLAGSMDGRFKVDERGAATYELAIHAARGTAGVTPRISMNYSSSDGDGIAGQGWSIGGLSAITRCRQTLAQDNNSTAIALNANDRFCLDGQRLMLVGGVYGGNGSTYRTEIDSYAVVTAYGNVTGNPAYFTVQRKDGSLSYYGDGVLQGGNRSAPAVNSAGAVLTWAISRFQDSVGNAIRFQYSSNGASNEHLISRIDYAYGADPGNSRNSTTYLQFNYQNRPDGGSGYVAGAKIARTQRLTSIRSVSDSVELRSYHFVYRNTDGGLVRSFVEKIYECVGADCIAPTTFDWQLNRGGFGPAVVLAEEPGAKLSTLRVLDIDGDGRSDLLYRRLSPPYPISYRLSNGTGFGPAMPLMASTVKSTNVDDASVAIFDVNGDGRQDLLHVDHGTGVYKGTLFLGGLGGFGAGTSYQPDLGGPVAADIDGDGLPDLAGTRLVPMYRRGQRIAVGGSWNIVFGALQPLVGEASSVPGLPPGCTATYWSLPNGLLADGTDFNGDGRVDFAAQMIYNQATCRTNHAGAAISLGNGNFSTLGWTAGIAMPSADMNGDGLADQWYDDATGNRQLRFSTGTAFTAPRLAGSTVDLERAMYLDYNGDGFPDLLWPSLFGVVVAQLFNPATESYGAPFGFFVPYQPATGIFDADRYLPIDIDGEGHVDVLRINHNLTGSTLTLYRSADAHGAGNRIVRIDNGAGNRTAITYKPLTDRSMYTVGSDARNAVSWPGAPVFDINAPHYVVARVDTTAPTAHPGFAGFVNHGAMRGTTYQYGGLKLESGGRGSLGFAWIKTIDEQTGVQSSTFYQQKFPFVGRPFATVVSSASGRAIRITSVAASQIVRNGIGGVRYFQIYDGTQEEFDFDPVSGVEVGFARTQNSAPDEWGNIPLISVSRYPADSHEAFLTRTLTFQVYGETLYDRRFGRVRTALVLHQRAGEPDVRRSSIFTYQPAGSPLEGLLATESIGAVDGAPIRTLSYRYDRFGNRNRTTVDAAGSASRYEETIFDVAGRFQTSRRGEFFDGGNWVPQVIENVLARNAYGQPTRLQRLNGLIVSYGYDALGRETRRSENTGAAVETRYIRGGINGAQYHIATTAATGAASTEYFDALGRSMAKEELGFDGRRIYRETEYDGLGRVRYESAPHYGGERLYWIVNHYDAFRLQSKSEPAAGGGAAITSFSYNGLVTTITNALGQRRVEVRNAAGEPVLNVDNLDGTVQYGYDAAGQVRLVTKTAMRDGRSLTVRTLSAYDSFGRKIKMVDSDRGTSFYSYNGFDELTDQYQVMTAGGNPNSYSGTLAQALGAALPMRRTSMQYDRRGRPIQRVDYRAGSVLESSTRWHYDIKEHGIGRLAMESIEGQNVGHQYDYDSFGRVVARHSTNDGNYKETVTYDAIGRIATLTDAAGSNSGTRNSYNAAGYLHSIEDMATGVALYRIRGRDARGHVTEAVLGNGAVQNWHYDGGSDHLLEQTALLGKTSLQKLAYSWDALGNPTSRWDRGVLAPAGTKDLRQSFCYDGLNRLSKTHQGTLSGSCALDPMQWDQLYDGFGNIVRKAGIGAFNYDAGHPFRLQGTADGVRYTYDAAGNVALDSGGRALDYTVFDKPSSIRRAGQRIDFSYGVRRELRKRIDHDPAAGEITTTHRIGNVEKISRADGSYELRRHIGGVALWSHRFDRNGVQTGLDKYYLLSDAQGTPVLFTSETGSLKQQLAYDPWGRRVWANNPTVNLPTAAFLPVSRQRTTAGFTGHDMLDAVGLVHMQGRVYDPRLGRFLQADPYVQAPRYLQSFNRYAYVFNAPLRFTDPSGFNGAGDDAVTLGSSLGNSFSSFDSLLSTVYVSGSGYSNTYTSFDAGNGYGVYNGLVDFNFGNAAAAPKALSVFSVIGTRSGGETIAGDRSRQQRQKAAALGEAFLPGAVEDHDTHMDCSTGVCYVTAARNIYLTGHRVRSIGPFHTALEYDNGTGVEWISARFDGYSLEGINRLVSEIGSLANGMHPNDAPSRNVKLGRITPPAELTADEYFQRLKDASQNYRNTADYDLFPDMADGYNSNSYIRGLLDATGGESSVDLGNFVGGEKPLPSHYFLRN